MSIPTPTGQSPFLSTSEHLRELEKSYQAGNETALYGAVQLLGFHGVGDNKDMGVPGWVWDGLIKVLEDHLLGRAPVSPGERSLKTQYKSKKVYYYRYVRVTRAKAEGATWEEAYEAAEKALSGTIARGSARAMKNSYLRVNKDLKNPERRMLYFPAIIPEADILLRDV